MRPADYKYSIAECDVSVERRSALDAFRAKRLIWLSWLDTDEHHAIWQAISAMVWTDVSFKALTHFAVADDNTCLSNSLVAEQLINGHVATQVLAIRRLVDNGADVISLRRLLKDVRRNFKFFTRENYVCYDGLPYDYEAVMQREIPQRVGKGAFWLDTTGPNAYGSSSMAHEQFDRLTGIAASARTREDRLPIRLLDTIEGWLDASDADALKDWSHAYLAHAGNPESRERKADSIITANKITDTIKVLARVTEAVSAYVLFAGSRLNALMPTAQFNQFERLDNPVMRADQLDEGHQIWDKLTDERDRYLEGVGSELESVTAPKQTAA